LNLRLKWELQQPPIIRAIQHNCARLYVWTIAALETGVKWKADLVCLQEPPRAREGVGISHPAYDIRKRKRVWAAGRTQSGIATNEWTDLCKHALGVIIVVDI
jgi:hypothetical protein